MCIKYRLVKHYVINNFEIGIKCQFKLEKLKYKYVIDSFLWKRIKVDSIQYLPSLKSYFIFRSVVNLENHRKKDITFFLWVKTILWMSINTFVDGRCRQYFAPEQNNICDSYYFRLVNMPHFYFPIIWK